MIVSDGINPRIAVSLVGLQTKIPEEQLIRLLPEEIAAQFKTDTLD